MLSDWQGEVLMSRKHSKDLFDDTTMSFGEHLEELRMRLWRAIVGLMLVTCVTMYYGDQVMYVVRKPIEDALKARGRGTEISREIAQMFDLQRLKDWWNGKLPVEPPALNPVGVSDPKIITVQVDPHELLAALHQADPERFRAPQPRPAEDTVQAPGEKSRISLKLSAPEFQQLQQVAEMQQRPIVLTVQEGFMTWLKVSFVAGLLFSSPWVFYQLWLFVAAGLYPHERRYVYVYLPVSTSLFLGGAVFCFFCVFPFVLDFLLSFSEQLKLQTQIRIADWINFAILLPVMFGISFQLPLVMLFLERLSIFEVKDYREKRRIAIFVITVVSMILTPAEPYSMIMMMVPMIGLYELGILICRWFPRPKPFDDEEESSAVATT
jgi:sec-independent protein translocase protein TatC